MRLAVSAVLAFLLLMNGEALSAGGCWCHFDEAETWAPPSSKADAPASSFRGISLASGPEDMRSIARSQGFLISTSFYVGDEATVSGIDLCRNGQLAGRADFDRQGRMVRLSLKDRFFYDKPVFVLDFAEDVFKTYGVKPLETADDVCFQDITCFRGISKRGEQFLIMRFGTEAELHVRPLNKPED
jgi:hypothetical protein